MEKFKGGSIKSTVETIFIHMQRALKGLVRAYKVHTRYKTIFDHHIIMISCL